MARLASHLFLSVVRLVLVPETDCTGGIVRSSRDKTCWSFVFVSCTAPSADKQKPSFQVTFVVCLRRVYSSSHKEVGVLIASLASSFVFACCTVRVGELTRSCGALIGWVSISCLVISKSKFHMSY